jgi:hypothetical protein
MKMLRSKRNPNRAPEMMSDEDYELLKKNGLAKRFIVTDIAPIKVIPKLVIPTTELKKAKKKKNEN